MTSHTEKKLPKKAEKSEPRITQLTAKRVIVFSLIMGIITLFIAYTVLLKTKVEITRATYPITKTISVTFSSEENDHTLPATLTTAILETTYTQNLEADTKTPGKATGTIRIKNTWNKDQPLQATTRFITSDGVLFRSTERVDVPAGGEATVPVEADQPGAAGDIPKGTQFILPALWAGLQDKIYGISENAFSGGEKTEAIVQEKDIEAAKNAALKELSEQAKTRAREIGTQTFVGQKTILLQQANATAGDSASQLSVTVRASYAFISYDMTSLHKTLYDELQTTLTNDESILRIDPLETYITIDRAQDTSVTATLAVTAQAQLQPNASILMPAGFTKKSQGELQELAEQEKGIAHIDVNFSPFWTKKTPSQSNKLEVIIR